MPAVRTWAQAAGRQAGRPLVRLVTQHVNRPGCGERKRRRREVKARCSGAAEVTHRNFSFHFKAKVSVILLAGVFKASFEEDK